MVGCDAEKDLSNPIEDGTNTADSPDSTESNQTLAIPEEDARYLQDVEHFGGFVLGDRAFPKINEAIKNQDWGAFESFFAPEFEGEIFIWDEAVTSKFDFASSAAPSCTST